MKKAVAFWLYISFGLNGSDSGQERQAFDGSRAEQESVLTRAGGFSDSFRQAFRKSKKSLDGAYHSEEALRPKPYMERLEDREFSQNYLDDVGYFVVGLLGSQYILDPFIKELGAPTKLAILGACGAGVGYKFSSADKKFKSAAAKLLVSTALLRNVTASDSLTAIVGTGATAWLIHKLF